LKLSRAAFQLYQRSPNLFPFDDAEVFDETVGAHWRLYEYDVKERVAEGIPPSEVELDKVCCAGTEGGYNLDVKAEDLTAHDEREVTVTNNFVFAIEYSEDETCEVYHLDSTVVESQDEEGHGGVQLYYDLLRLWGQHKKRPGFLYGPTLNSAFEGIKATTTGIDDVLDNIKKYVFTMHAHPHEATKLIKKPTALLLHGPPGTGKTTTVRKLLKEVGVFVIYVGSAAELKRPYIGETEKLIKFLFDQCNNHPELLCAVFLDEIDNITESRSSDSGTHKQDWISLLLRIIGSEDYPNLLLIGSTNRKSAMDEAIFRPGRIDEHFFFPTLGAEAR